MDLEMPVMDGYEATAQLKQQAPDLPVIALTAHVLNETQKRCLACGMVAYVKKPVVIEELVQAIQEIL
jgi:two-component system sensor histidine kinase/response regulator